MKQSIIDRVVFEAKYIVDNEKTIREIAKNMGVSKSTVHKDLQQRLKNINIDMWKNVNQILKKHIEIRHIRGGIATQNKYLKIKKNYVKTM